MRHLPRQLADFRGCGRALAAAVDFVLGLAAAAFTLGLAAGVAAPLGWVVGWTLGVSPGFAGWVASGASGSPPPKVKACCSCCFSSVCALP